MVEVKRDMPSHAYHAVVAASASRLKEFMRSPAHLRVMDRFPKQSSAFALGEAFHACVLEPKRFHEDFVVAPDVDRRTTAGKAAWAEFVESSGGKTVLTAADYGAATSMAQAVEEHTTARDLIGGLTERELSVFWKADWPNGTIPCKARIDGYNIEQRCIVDLKSTTDASRAGFTKSVANFSYHIQAAWYMAAMKRAGFDVEGMVFIAVEKEMPFAVACYQLDHDAITEGATQIARAIPVLIDCIARDNWPAYTELIETISLPRWKVAKEEETL
jgi:exodeoxyribonuclease VIII